MRVTHKVPLWVLLMPAIIAGIMPASCGIRLGPFLAQLKDGPFANEIGTGGILVLAFAGNYFGTLLHIITPDSNSRTIPQGRSMTLKEMKQVQADQLALCKMQRIGHC